MGTIEFQTVVTTRANAVECLALLLYRSMLEERLFIHCQREHRAALLLIPIPILQIMTTHCGATRAICF